MKKNNWNLFMKKIWKKPVLKAPYGHRQASWIELFFDLIFVGAFGVLNIVNFEHGFHLIPEQFLMYILGFVAIWIIWMNITYYSNMFENRSIRHRVVLFLNIIIVGMLTYGINDKTSGEISTQGMIYLFAFIISRLILIFSWRNAYRSDIPKPLKKMIDRFTLLYLVSISISLVTFFLFAVLKLPLIYGIVLWTLTLILELTAGPVILAISQKNITSIHREHIVERFGLLTMLLLGEVIINALGGFRQNINLNIEISLRNIGVILFIFMYWWIYYEQVMTGAYQEDSRSRIIWTSFQFLFALTTMLISSVTRELTSSVELTYEAQRLLLIPIIMFFFTIVSLSVSIDISDIVETEELRAGKYNIPREYIILGGARMFTVLILALMFTIRIKSTMIMTLILIGIMGMHIMLGEYARKSLSKYGSKKH